MKRSELEALLSDTEAAIARLSLVAASLRQQLEGMDPEPVYDPRSYCSTGIAMRLTGLSSSQLYRMARAKQIRAMRRNGGRGAWVFDRASLIEHVRPAQAA
jgi:hypothetical protein